MDTHAGTGGTVDEAAIREFIDAHVARVAPLALRLNEEYWQLNITGKDEHAREAAKLSAEHTKVYANADEFAMLRDWREAVIDDTELARQVELLYLAYLGNQKDDETIERISALEMELETEYSNHRGLLDGKPTSDNDLKEVLANETDSAGRRAAWEASKSIGPKVAPRVLELVRLRNATARKMGFATYYQMSLAQQELEEAELFALLARPRGPHAGAVPRHEAGARRRHLAKARRSRRRTDALALRRLLLSRRYPARTRWTSIRSSPAVTRWSWRGRRSAPSASRSSRS